MNKTCICKAFCLFNRILHLNKDIELAKLSQPAAELPDPAAWNVDSACCAFLGDFSSKQGWDARRSAHRYRDGLPRGTQRLRCTFLPSSLTLGSYFLLVHTCSKAKRLFTRTYMLFKDGETLIVTYHGNFAIDFTKHGINPRCRSPEPCKTGNIIRKAHFQRIKLTVCSLVNDFISAV